MQFNHFQGSWFNKLVFNGKQWSGKKPSKDLQVRFEWYRQVFNWESYLPHSTGAAYPCLLESEDTAFKRGRGGLCNTYGVCKHTVGLQQFLTCTEWTWLGPQGPDQESLLTQRIECGYQCSQACIHHHMTTQDLANVLALIGYWRPNKT